MAFVTFKKKQEWHSSYLMDAIAEDVLGSTGPIRQDPLYRLPNELGPYVSPCRQTNGSLRYTPNKKREI